MQTEDQKVHICQLNNDTLQETKTLPHDGGIMDVAYSPDGAYLAAVDTFRKMYLYQLPDYQVSIHGKYVELSHTIYVTSTLLIFRVH